MRTSGLRIITRATSSAARIVYPVKPPVGVLSGRIIDDPLFHKMSHIPPETFAGALDNLHDEEESHHVKVGNGRDITPSLLREGFELWDWPTKVDFSSDEAILSEYYSEMEDRVRAATGAEYVVGFHHLRRDGARDNKDSSKGPGGLQSNQGAAVFRAHSDYTVANALLRIEQVEAAGKLPAGTTAECAAGRRAYSIINVWRGLETVEREPLAVLDASRSAGVLPPPCPLSCNRFPRLATFFYADI